MKLFVTMSLANTSTEMHKLFMKHGAIAFHETETRGFNLPGKKEHRVDNWFSHSKLPVEGLLNFVLVTSEQATVLLEEIKKENEKKGEADAIRAFVMDVEQFI